MAVSWLSLAGGLVILAATLAVPLLGLIGAWTWWHEHRHTSQGRYVTAASRGRGAVGTAQRLLPARRVDVAMTMVDSDGLLGFLRRYSPGYRELPPARRSDAPGERLRRSAVPPSPESYEEGASGALAAPHSGGRRRRQQSTSPGRRRSS